MQCKLSIDTGTMETKISQYIPNIFPSFVAGLSTPEVSGPFLVLAFGADAGVADVVADAGLR